MIMHPEMHFLTRGNALSPIAPYQSLLLGAIPRSYATAWIGASQI
jgi:hypothetical protein